MTLKKIGIELDKVGTDIRQIEKYELPKLNEDKSEEYKQKLVKFQLKLNKQRAQYEKVKDGSDASIASMAPEGSELRQRLLTQD